MRYRIVELRKNKNLTQLQLAELLCTTQSHISRIENNHCEISPFLLNDMAKFFNVSTNYILGETEELEPNVEKKYNLHFLGINEFDDIIEKYKSLSDKHKAAVKLNIDFYFQLEQSEFNNS